MDKWYKVLDKNLKAKDGGNFDYSRFVKSKKWLPEIKDLVLCDTGYHVTKYWNMFFDNKDCRVFEVEVKGLVEQQGSVGVVEKAVCSSFRIIKEFKPKLDNKNNAGDSNAGHWNTGYWNTGNYNAGDWNTGNYNAGHRNAGYYNAGDRNTGDSNAGYRNAGYYNAGDRNAGNYNAGHNNAGHRNTGDSNTGNRNTGYWNTGHSNAGDWNTGNSNAGHWNTGYWNVGDRNTGDSNAGDRNAGHRNTGNSNAGHCNAGDRNTGHWNTGESNTGNWNSANYHVGAFNTKDADKVYLFDKEIKKKDYDKIHFPNYFYFELGKDYKKSWLRSFEEASEKEIEDTLKLPNFDYEVFEKITGISKIMIENRIKELEGEVEK